MSASQYKPQTAGETGSDEQLLQSFGYKQELRRAMGGFASFCVAFSVISAGTAVFTSFGAAFTAAGPSFVLIFLVSIAVQFVWVLIATDLASRMPIAGYSYQWVSRMANRDVGWFTGFLGVLGYLAGMTGVVYTLAGYFESIVGIPETRNMQVGLTVGFLIVVGLINIVGVKIASRLNNIGAVAEMVATIGGTIALGIALALFLSPAHHLSFLLEHQSGGGSRGLGLLSASMLTMWGLFGVTSIADVAEETRDAHRTVPRSMITAFSAAAATEFLMYLVFTLAIPNTHDVETSSAPLTDILNAQVGKALASTYVALILVGIFACAIGNVLVLTRLVFSLSRDNMLPWSSGLRKVDRRFQAPINSIIVMVVLSSLIVISSLIASQAVNYIVGLSVGAFFGVFILTSVVALRSQLRNRMKGFEHVGTFNLGSATLWIYTLGVILFAAVLVLLCVMSAYRNSMLDMGLALILAVAWYVFWLRPRLRDGRSGYRVDRENF